MIPPDRVEINITELCNKTCWFCPRGHGYPNQNLNMTLDTLDALLSQMHKFDHKPQLSITGRGEPSLHKDLNTIIEKCIPHFRTIEVTTNGDRLHKMDFVRDKKVQYCVNSYDSHEQYLERKEKYPEFHHNDKSEGLNGYTNRGGWIDTEVIDMRCYILIRRLYIDWNGNIMLCCHDWKHQHSFGNVHTDDIADVWYNKLNNVRKDLLVGDRSCTKACSECNAGADEKDMRYFLDNA